MGCLEAHRFRVDQECAIGVFHNSDCLWSHLDTFRVIHCGRVIHCERVRLREEKVNKEIKRVEVFYKG